MKNIVLVLFLLTFGVEIYGQDAVELTVSPGAEIDGNILAENREKVLKSVEALINEYLIAGSMLSEKDNRVTHKSVKRFQAMFRPGAMVVHDFHEIIDQELVSAQDYSLGVFNNLKLSGVEFQIEKAELKSLTLDGTGYYTPHVQVTKVMYNYLTQSGMEKKAVTGIRLEQNFYFDIYKDDLTLVTISKIDHFGEFVPIAEETSLVGLSFGVGSSAFNTKTSAYWDKEHRSATLDPNGGLNYSIGVEFLSDKFITKKASTQRLFAWSFGLRYASYQMKTDLMSLSLDDFNVKADDPAVGDNDQQTYVRHVGPVDAIEEIRFNTLEIPLGVNLNVSKTQKNTIYIGLKYTMGIVLGSQGTVSGEGVYDGTLIDEDETSANFGNASTFDFLNDIPREQLELTNGYDPFLFGTRALSFETEPELASAVSSLVVSPTGYFNFTDNRDDWGFMIAFDLGYQFGSFLNHAPIDDIEDEAFKDDQDFTGSLLNYYADNLSALNFGMRLGVFRRISDW